MNGVQQRTHKSHRDQQLKDLATILQELDERIVELARIVEILDHRTVDLGKGTAEAYNALGETVGQLQELTTLLKHDDLEHERVIVRLRPLAETTLLERLSWLLTGRC